MGMGESKGEANARVLMTYAPRRSQVGRARTVRTVFLRDESSMIRMIVVSELFPRIKGCIRG